MPAAQKTFFKLTFLDLKNEATHAIGGAPDANAPLARTVNAAIEYLWNCHNWSFRETIQTLDFNAGVGQIALPVDFGEMIDVVGNQVRYTAVKPAQWRDVVRVRVYGLPDQQILMYHVGAGGQYSVPNPTALLTNAGGTGGALVAGAYVFRYSWVDTQGNETAGSPEQGITLTASQTKISLTIPALPTNAASANVYLGTIANQEQLLASGVAPGTYNATALPASSAAFWPQANSTYDPTAVEQRVLEVAPLPASTVIQALMLTYSRLCPQLVNDTDVPQLPYGMFDLLKTLVRAFAVSSTTQQMGHDWQRFNDELPRYKSADTMATGAPGGMIDALEGDDGLYSLAPWNSIKTAYDP